MLGFSEHDIEKLYDENVVHRTEPFTTPQVEAVNPEILRRIFLSGHGSVANIASILGLIGGSLSPAYAASKGGVVNRTRTMALPWVPRVRVNCVCQGRIE